jgi:hypothetical protein
MTNDEATEKLAGVKYAKPEHTQLTWEFFEGTRGGISFVYSPRIEIKQGEEIIAVVEAYPRKGYGDNSKLNARKEAIAERIVRAVDAHDELVEACRLMLIEHERINEQFKLTADTPGMALGRAALAKAVRP